MNSRSQRASPSYLYFDHRHIMTPTSNGLSKATNGVNMGSHLHGSVLGPFNHPKMVIIGLI